MRTEFLCISALRVASGPRVKFADCMSALNSRWFILLTVLRLCFFFLLGPGCGGVGGGRCGLWLWHSLDFSLTFFSLTLCCIVVYSTRRFVLSLALCYFVFVFQSFLALRLSRLGKRQLIYIYIPWGYIFLIFLYCGLSFFGYIIIYILLLYIVQDPVVQSVVSLTSSLRVISLTVLADSIYNILIFFAEKMWVAFAMQKLLTFFQQKSSAYLRIIQCKF